MINADLEYFRNKLITEKRRVNNILKQMERNETINSNSEMASELSFYDNHPSDLATELQDKERGMAFKGNEVTIIKKIDDALSKVDDGSYGKCRVCGKDIPRERLEFIPYADMCVSCQSDSLAARQNEKDDRPVEEDVLGSPFGTGYNDVSLDGEVGFDAEDSYQSVQKFDYRRRVSEFGDYDDEDYDFDNEMGYVEPVEKISNEQYKRTIQD